MGIVVSDLTRRKALSLGDVGAIWLSTLGTVVDELCADWSVEIDRRLDGGTGSWVALVRSPVGPAVLKVAVPDSQVADATTVLAAAAGRGYVRVLEQDVNRNAVLLEPLGRSLDDVGLSVPEQMDVIASLLLRAWQVDAPVRDHDKVEGLARIYDEMGAGAPPEVLAEARACLERRAADVPVLVVVHGDPHAPNVHERLDGGFALIDPEPFRGDPAYDLGVAVRGHLRQATRESVRGWCLQLAESTGLDDQAIWDWGFAERVSTGAYLQHLGETALGDAYLRSAVELLRRR